MSTRRWRASSTPVDVVLPGSYVAGLCARFINYDAEFQPPNAAQLEFSELDKAVQKAAKKHLITLIRGQQNGDPRIAARRGYAYKRAYRKAAGAALSRLGAQAGPAAEIFGGEWLDYGVLIGEGADARLNTAQLTPMSQAGSRSFLEYARNAVRVCVRSIPFTSGNFSVTTSAIFSYASTFTMTTRSHSPETE